MVSITFNLTGAFLPILLYILGALIVGIFMNENGKFSSPDNSLTTSLLFIFAWPIVSIMVTFMLYIYEPFIEKRIDYLVEKWKTHKKRGSDLADELGLGLDDNTDDMGPL